VPHKKANNGSDIDLNASGGPTNHQNEIQGEAQPHPAPDILGIQSLSILLLMYLFLKYNKSKRN